MTILGRGKKSEGKESGASIETGSQGAWVLVLALLVSDFLPGPGAGLVILSE